MSMYNVLSWVILRLMYAVLRDQLELVKILLSYNAYCNKRDRRGRNVFDFIELDGTLFEQANVREIRNEMSRILSEAQNPT